MHIQIRKKLVLCCVQSSCPTLCNLWTIDHQTPLSTGLSRQEYWTVLCPHSGKIPYPGTEPTSLTSPALADRGSPGACPAQKNLETCPFSPGPNFPTAWAWSKAHSLGWGFKDVTPTSSQLPWGAPHPLDPSGTSPSKLPDRTFSGPHAAQGWALNVLGMDHSSLRKDCRSDSSLNHCPQQGVTQR